MHNVSVHCVPVCCNNQGGSLLNHGNSERALELQCVTPTVFIQLENKLFHSYIHVRKIFAGLKSILPCKMQYNAKQTLS